MTSEVPIGLKLCGSSVKHAPNGLYFIQKPRQNCKRCNKPFQSNTWVVKREHGKGYYLYNHIECFTDAKGRPIYEAPKAL